MFYKGRSQEKTHLLRLKFFLLLSPLDRARSVLLFRALRSVAGQCNPVVWVFSTSGFHRFLATKPVSCCKTFEGAAVTAEIASSSLVVPAILKKHLQKGLHSGVATKRKRHSLNSAGNSPFVSAKRTPSAHDLERFTLVRTAVREILANR